MKKKSFIFRYDPKRGLKSDAEDAIKTGKKEIRSDEILFASMQSLFKFATPIKVEIIEAINKHHPKSIYELAKLLNKDQGFIQKEVTLLEDLEVIELTESVSNGRKIKTPTTKYSTIEMVFNVEEDKKRVA